MSDVTRALRIGRAYVWIYKGWRPRLYAKRAEDGTLFVGVGYWAGCYFPHSVHPTEKQNG